MGVDSELDFAMDAASRLDCSDIRNTKEEKIIRTGSI